MFERGLSLFALLLVLVVPALPLHFWIRSLLRIGLGTAGLISIVINLFVLIMVLWLSSDNGSFWSDQHSTAQMHFQQRFKSDNAPIYILALIFTANLSIALAIKLYRAAILGKTTPEERSPGIVGFRAWLSPVNVITIVGIAVGAYLSLDYDYLGVAVVGFCVLLVCPTIATLMQSSSGLTPRDEASPLKAPAEERQRVLALVELGKISAEDGAELLTALAQSQAAGSAVSVISGARRAMLVGAAITLVAFFLPWFTLDLTQAIHDATSGLQQTIPQFPGNPQSNVTFSSPNFGMNGTPVAVQNGMQIQVRGGDVQHGLGWIILAASFCGACFPFFWTPTTGNARQLRSAIFAALTIGSVLTLYVLSGSFNAATSVDSGFMLAIVGYVVLWAAAIREYTVSRATFHAALAGA